MRVLDLANLTSLMELTSGRSETRIGLIDGPVAIDHPDLARQNIRETPGQSSGACSQASSAACIHGTFVAGVLCAKRGSIAPAICPDCSLLVRPIFKEATSGNGQIRSKSFEDLPSATPQELAEAIIETINAGAHVINLSAGLAQPSINGERELQEALDYAARRGVIVVAAAGNQGTIGSSAITRHPWVISIVACDLEGRPISQSNLASSIARRGLRAPGGNVTSLGGEGKPLTLAGTSVAAPFVTGTIALLWSEFPNASAVEVLLAVTIKAYNRRTSTIVPPLLDAWRAYQVMQMSARRQTP
jgi:subtilisin family serine protease